MNLPNKLNSILKEYSEGNKTSAYKKFKKIYFQNNKDIKLRYNLAVMQQELGLLDEAENNYMSLILDRDEPKYNINLYNLSLTTMIYPYILMIYIYSFKIKSFFQFIINSDTFCMISSFVGCSTLILDLHSSIVNHFISPISENCSCFSGLIDNTLVPL